MQVVERNGVFLPQFELWLDPHSAKDAAFVSHAHADHMKKHKRVFATPATCDMMRARGAIKSQFHRLSWRETVAWGRANVSFHPAGHVLGSAQTLVECNGTRLLYSGDFKMRDSLSSEKIEVPRADILVMETTFGRPNYEFPDSAHVLKSIRNWCRKTLENGEIPVLFCYSLGKGQEILAGLCGCDFPVYVHAKHGQISRVYQDHGAMFCDFRVHEPFARLDGALLCASQCRRSKWWHELENSHRLRTAYISGWALDALPRRFGCDAAFALSDHAGYSDLLEYVRQSGAQKVWTTHGFAAEFAHDLRERGLEAAPLHEAARREAARHEASRRERQTQNPAQLCFDWDT